jgi:oligosaccharide reducing-end xylanase
MRRRGTTSTRDAGTRVDRSGMRAVACALALGVIASCGTTVDPIGYNGAAGLPLGPLTGPAMYPNAFRDLLGKTDAEIAAKIDGGFAQLFHGDMTQAIYFAADSTHASIQDVFHSNEVRTEGMGYGMLIAVEVDKPDEFDSLWTYAKSTLRVTSGASSGYFNSFCDTDTIPVACLDPFGLQQMTMALILAEDRFVRNATAPRPGVDYAADARDLLTLMRHKQDENGGIVDGVTDTFDTSTGLVFDAPDISAAGIGRPSIEMPAYYDLWAQATGDPFWTAAAKAARGYWQRTANPTTGLTPVRATFAGVPVAGSEVFEAEAYRAQLAMVLDQIWSSGNAWNSSECDHLVQFFYAQGIDTYGMSYSLDGATMLNANHDIALVAANGTAALIATVQQRTAFVQAVWDMAVPTGFNRYYAGLVYLHALLALGGQLRIY